MPPKCRLQTGANSGIRPRGCTFQTDGDGVPLRGRSAAATGGLPDVVTVAKQRPIGNERKVFRRVRITYQGKSQIFDNYLLDTGAYSELLMPKSHFQQLLPSRGGYASPWARFVAETTLPTIAIAGAIPGAVANAYQADVYLEIELNIGRKGSGQTAFRGGPTRAKVLPGGQQHLIGASFLRKHNVLVK